MDMNWRPKFSIKEIAKNECPCSEEYVDVWTIIISMCMINFLVDDSKMLEFPSNIKANFLPAKEVTPPH